MLLRRFHERDCDVAGAPTQDRRHSDAGSAAADDENLMMLPVRH
jgi:hypothetical protein